MSPQQVSAPRQTQKLIAWPLALLTSFVLVCGFGIAASTAQAPPKEEREVEDKIPKHLPIKVKVKNLEKVKDLDNEHWLRDVEIEIQNTGDKPIYYVRLALYIADLKPETADQYGWTLGCGKAKFINLDERPTPEDVPLKPGEACARKVPAGLVTGWGKYRAARNLPHPKKIGLQFEFLSYGDGTAFVGTGGDSIPHPPSSRCVEQRNEGTVLKASQSSLGDRPPDAQIKLLNLLPASFLPVNFLPAKFIAPARSPAITQSGSCCPGTSCFYLKATLGGTATARRNWTTQ